MPPRRLLKSWAMPPRKLPDCFHLLRLPQRVLSQFEVDLRRHRVGDVPADRIEDIATRRHVGNCRPAERDRAAVRL